MIRLLRLLHALARGVVIVLSMVTAAACGQGYGLTLSTCAHVNAQAGSRLWPAAARKALARRSSEREMILKTGFKGRL